MAITYGSEYPFNSLISAYVSSAKIDETHFVVACSAGSDGDAVIGTISGTTISYGTVYEFRNGATNWVSVSLLDATHFVVAYQGNNGVGIAMVGTISNDDEIAFGSEYTFNSASTDNISVTALDATTFIVAFGDDGGDDYGIAMIGTVSNINEIAFGAEYIFNSAVTSHISVTALDATHFVVAYKDGGNSNYGTAILADISNGAIHAFGSEYVFNSASTNNISVTALDATHFVISYVDGGNSNYGTAIVGTVTIAGLSIAYGSEYAFNEAATTYPNVGLIDATHFVISYVDGGNSNYGTAIVGTISSVDQIAYGTEYPFNEADTRYISVAGLDATHVIIGYMDDGNSDYGTAIHGTVDFPWSNKIMGVAAPAKINGVAVASIASVNGV